MTTRILVQLLHTYCMIVTCFTTNDDYIHNISDSNSFYILDNIPSKYMSAWPLPEQDIYPRKKHALDYKHEYGINFGAGRAINVTRGIYATHNPDHLYHTIMTRLRVHPQRTLDRQKACLLVIPLDLGIFSWFHSLTGQFRYNFGKGCEDMDHLEGLLAKAVDEAPLWGHEMLYISSSLGFLSYRCLKIMRPCVNCTRVSFQPNMNGLGFHARYTWEAFGINVTYREFGIPGTPR